MQVKRDDMKGMAGLSHSLGLPQEDLPKGEPYSWLESARARARTPAPRGSLAGRSPKSQEEVLDPGILHSATLLFLHQHANPGKGMASMPTDARNRGEGCSSPTNSGAARSSPHGVRDLWGDEHGQPPGGPVLFQRRAQDQGSFGVGIVCGQCHKGLILIQGKRTHIHYTILPRKHHPRTLFNQ